MSSAETMSMMSMSHELSGPADDAGWPLADAGACRLRIGPGPRWLRVAAGLVWLTTSGRGAVAGRDHWLRPGEQLWLPDGSDVVVEGFDGARFELLVPPQACCSARSSLPATLARRLAAAAAVLRRPSLEAAAVLAG